MNIAYLVKIVGSEKLLDTVGLVDAPPLDMNIAIWEAIKRGDIRVEEDEDPEKSKIYLLNENPEPWHDSDLATKIIKVAQHYATLELNVNKGRLDGYIKDPVSGKGYPMHEYLMTLQFLLDSGQLVQEVVSVPGIKGKRPPHKFAFLCLPENAEQNQEWNAKQVNNWIDNWKPNKVK